MKHRRKPQTPFFRSNSSRLSRVYTRKHFRIGYKNFQIGLLYFFILQRF